MRDSTYIKHLSTVSDYSFLQHSVSITKLSRVFSFLGEKGFAYDRNALSTYVSRSNSWTV
jgi:hypothetical protein